MRLLSLLFLFVVLLPAQGAPPLQDWIQEAIKAGGGVVTVPDGVHTLAEPLVIENAKKLALRGMGREGCVLRLARPGPAVLEIRGDCEAVELAGITLQGGGVRVMGGKDIQVRDSLLREQGWPRRGAPGYRGFGGPALQLPRRLRTGPASGVVRAKD